MAVSWRVVPVARSRTCRSEVPLRDPVNRIRALSMDQTGIGSTVAGGLPADSPQAQPPTANSTKTFRKYSSLRRLTPRQGSARLEEQFRATDG